MGVLGLWEILEQVGHPIKIEGLEGKVLGVDANIWLYKFIRGFREKDTANCSIESHKLGLFNRVCKLLFYRIKPVFVFDGPAPVLKRRTLEKRQNIRHKQLEKVREAAMRALVNQLKSQYPNANIDDLKIHLPELKSNNLVFAEKLTDQDFDLFYLPPNIRNKEDDEESSDDAVEEISDSNGDAPYYEVDERLSNSKIDINSKDFEQLPPEIRYEILHDIKESQRRIRNVDSLPDDSGSFSNLQLQRLKTRRHIQEKIEKCEKDICSNYTGELSDGNLVKAFRVQSDATSTLLFRSTNDESNDNKHVVSSTVESKDLSSSQPKCDTNDQTQSPSKSYRPSLKLLFAEKKTDSSYIRLPGTRRTPLKSSQMYVTENGPVLSPEHTSDESKDSISDTSKSSGDQDGQSSDVSTIIDDVSSNSEHELDSDLQPVVEEEHRSDDAIHEKFSPSKSSNKANETIDLATPKDELKSKSCAQNQSVVDLTDSTAGSDVEEIDFNPAGVSTKTNVTIEITDNEDEQSENESLPKATENNTPLKLDESCQELINCQQPISGAITGSQTIEENEPAEQQSQIQTRTIVEKETTTVPQEATSKASPSFQSQSSKDFNVKTISDLNMESAMNAQRANKVTAKIIEDAKELLRLFGIPYMDAAGEAEAQCALLEKLSLTAGTITDDSDIWLFGAKNVYRHFFSDNKYVSEYKMNDIEFHIRMTRENLICFAMLVGSDYTDGIMNVGPVTAIEILSEFQGDGIESLRNFSDWQRKARDDKTLVGKKAWRKLLKYNLPDDFPSRAVYEGYLRPIADLSTEQFSWGTPDLDELREYAHRNFGWDQKKADEKLLPVMKKLNEKKLQRTIDTFFFKTQANRNPEMFRSKRVNQALNKIAKRAARGDRVAAAAAPTEEVNLSEDDD